MMMEIIMMIIIVIITNSLFQPGDFSAGSLLDRIGSTKDIIKL